MTLNADDGNNDVFDNEAETKDGQEKSEQKYSHGGNIENIFSPCPDTSIV